MASSALAVVKKEPKEEPEETPAEETTTTTAAPAGDEEASNAGNTSKALAVRSEVDGASPGKIFVGGLPKDTTDEAFTKHFGKYGKISDFVIMKHRGTGHPRGFGFITYEDASVVDAVIVDEHDFGGKKVEIKRTIPKGANSGKDFKTKKIFVGGIPSTVNEDEFKNFFAKFGEVEEHQIMRDHTTGRSRGFGFISFSAEKAVDDLLIKGNRIELAGVQVEIKKAEPKKAGGNAPLPSAFAKHFNDPAPSYGRGGSYRDPYDSFGSGAYRYGSSQPRSYGTGYGVSDFDTGYGGYESSAIGSYRREPSLGFSSRYGTGGGLGRGYDFGAYDGPSDGYGRYGAGGYGGGYESGPLGGYGGGYGGAAAGGYGGAAGSYGGAAGGSGLYGGPRREYGTGPSGRYHPYGR